MEEFRDIEIIEGYQISNFGNIRNSNTLQVLKTRLINTGYKAVEIRRKSYMIHRLVAIYFIPNPDDKKYIDHIDNDISNNHYTNLRWVTSSENYCNKKIYKNSSTGIKGISYIKSRGKYRVSISFNNNKYYLGFFADLEKAKLVRVIGAKKLFGEYMHKDEKKLYLETMAKYESPKNIEG